MPRETPAVEPTIAVTVEHDDGRALVKVAGELEFGTAATLRAAIIDLSRQHADPLVLDLADLEFIDSTGLSLLVQAKQRVEGEGHRFVLRNLNARTRRLLDLAGMLDLFTIE